MLDQLKKMSNAELVSATQQLVDVWTTDDSIFQVNPRPVVEMYFTKDAVYEDASFPVNATAKGHDQICQLILDGFPGILKWRFYITNAALVGDRLAMEWYWSGVHDKKVWMGIPPRGNKFCVRGSTWISVNDEGKVTHSVDYYDRLTMMHQLWHEQPAEVPARYLKK